MENQQQAAQAEGQLAIQRLYVKDLSFEAPTTPHVFQSDWQPELHVDLNTESNQLQDGLHEVVLRVTVTVKSEKKHAFLVEVKQAGIFAIKGLSEEQLKPALGIFCPSVLYPYAREVVTDVVTRGGFPQLVLAPVNFESLYAQEQEAQLETH